MTLPSLLLWPFATESGKCYHSNVDLEPDGSTSCQEKLCVGEIRLIGGQGGE